MGKVALSAIVALGVLAPAAHAVSWSAPAALMPKVEGSRFSVAVNARGEQAFVWEEARVVSPAPRFRQLTTVGARTRTASGRFGPVQTLRRSTQAIFPDVALAPDGTAIAAWNRVYRGHLRIFAAVCRPARKFGRPVQLGRTDKAQGAQPQVEFDPRGNAIVLWRWSDRLQWSYRPRARGFGAARTIFVGSRARRAAIDEKSFAFDRHGFAYLAIASHGARRGIHLALRRPRGRFGRPRRVSPAGEWGSQPAVATSGAGTAVLIWRTAPATGTEEEFGRIKAAAVSGRRAGPVQEVSAVSGTEPQVRLTPSGEAIAVWRQFHGGAASGPPFWQEIAASVRPPGGAFGAPVALSPAPTDAQRPSLVVTDEGEAVAVWDQRVGEVNSVLFATRPPATVFSPPQHVAPAFVSFVAGAGRHVVVLLVTPSGVGVVTGTG